MGMLGAAGRSGAHRKPEGPEDLFETSRSPLLFFFFYRSPPLPPLPPHPKKEKIHPHLRETQSNPIPKPPHPPRYLRSQVPTWSTGFFPLPQVPRGRGGVQAGGTSPPPPLFFIFNFTRGSGDLRGFGVFPAGFCCFQPFFLVFFFPAGIPLVAPWGGGGVLVASWTLLGGGLGGSVQLLLLLGSSPAPRKEKFQGGIFTPRAGLDFLSDFFALYSHYFGLFWVFFNYFPSFPCSAPLLFIFVFESG